MEGHGRAWKGMEHTHEHSEDLGGVHDKEAVTDVRDDEDEGLPPDTWWQVAGRELGGM